eukprot:1260667-Pleurochrysis_carterae.AAC.3
MHLRQSKTAPGNVGRDCKKEHSLFQAVPFTLLLLMHAYQSSRATLFEWVRARAFLPEGACVEMSTVWAGYTTSDVIAVRLVNERIGAH